MSYNKEDYQLKQKQKHQKNQNKFCFNKGR